MRAANQTKKITTTANAVVSTLREAQCSRSTRESVQSDLSCSFALDHDRTGGRTFVVVVVVQHRLLLNLHVI